MDPVLYDSELGELFKKDRYDAFLVEYKIAIIKPKAAV